MRRVLFALACCFLWEGVAAIDSFVNQSCENSNMGVSGWVPRSEGLYYVAIIEEQTGPDPLAQDPKDQFIVSLCNMTLKTPRETHPCARNLYFIAQWDKNGTCIETYGSVETAKYNATNNSYEMIFIGDEDPLRSVSVILCCQPSTTLAVRKSNKKFSIEMEVESLCVTSPPPTNGNGGDSKGSAWVIIVVVVVVIVVAAVVGVVIFDLKRENSFLKRQLRKEL